MTAPSGWTEEGSGEWSRIDPDGTHWMLAAEQPGVYALTMRYRDHRLISRHDSLQAAAKHRDDMASMLRARSLRDYVGGR